MANVMERRARRSPTADELHAWRVFVEAGDELRSALASRFAGESGISAGDYSVLLAISETDGRRIRSSDLATHIGWERSRLSHHLGRMESRGLIRREDCATDNRGAEITFTEAGSSTFRRSNTPHLHAVRELFVDALSPAQLAAAREIGEALRAHLAGER